MEWESECKNVLAVPISSHIPVDRPRLTWSKRTNITRRIPGCVVTAATAHDRRVTAITNNRRIRVYVNVKVSIIIIL